MKSLEALQITCAYNGVQQIYPFYHKNWREKNYKKEGLFIKKAGKWDKREKQYIPSESSNVDTYA